MRAERTSKDEFLQGFAEALGSLVREHGQPSLAVDIMCRNGITLKDLEDAGAEEVDLGPLREEWGAKLKVNQKSVPGPITLLREFAAGNWTNMLAEKYGVDESHIESKLMEAARKLLLSPTTKLSVSEIMREMGRRGGIKGAASLNSSLTPEQRKLSAQNASRARWAKRAKTSRGCDGQV